MKISIMGTGYVGLSTGVGFAKKGNSVLCFDVAKVDLEEGLIKTIRVFKQK